MFWHSENAVLSRIKYRWHLIFSYLPKDVLDCYNLKMCNLIMFHVPREWHGFLMEATLAPKLAGCMILSHFRILVFDIWGILSMDITPAFSRLSLIWGIVRCKPVWPWFRFSEKIATLWKKKALGMCIGYSSTRTESTNRGDIAWMQIVCDSKNLKKIYWSEKVLSRRNKAGNWKATDQ